MFNSALQCSIAFNSFQQCSIVFNSVFKHPSPSSPLSPQAPQVLYPLRPLKPLYPLSPLKPLNLLKPLKSSKPTQVLHAPSSLLSPPNPLKSLNTYKLQLFMGTKQTQNCWTEYISRDLYFITSFVIQYSSIAAAWRRVRNISSWGKHLGVGSFKCP